MTKKERFNKVFPILEEKFKKPITALEYETPYQLLIAVILSAQCTDVRVNIVTKELFKIVKEPKDLAEMSLKEIEKHIKSTGFYKIVCQINCTSSLKNTSKADFQAKHFLGLLLMRYRLSLNSFSLTSDKSVFLG